MASLNRHSTGNADVYEAVGAAAIEAGLLVVPSAAVAPSHPELQGIDVAGDNAKNVLGVTQHRSAKVALQNNGSTTDGEGFPNLAVSQVTETTTVLKGVVCAVTYADTSTYSVPGVAFGAKLVSAAGGKVRPFNVADPDSGGSLVADTDYRAIVGECRQIGGVGGAGGVALALIY